MRNIQPNVPHQKDVTKKSNHDTKVRRSLPKGGSGHRPAPYERVCVGQSNVELAFLQPILLVAAATVIFANIAERRLEGI